MRRSTLRRALCALRLAFTCFIRLHAVSLRVLPCHHRICTHLLTKTPKAEKRSPEQSPAYTSPFLYALPQVPQPLQPLILKIKSDKTPFVMRNQTRRARSYSSWEPQNNNNTNPESRIQIQSPESRQGPDRAESRIKMVQSTELRAAPKPQPEVKFNNNTNPRIQTQNPESRQGHQLPGCDAESRIQIQSTELRAAPQAPEVKFNNNTNPESRPRIQSPCPAKAVSS